MQPFAPAVLRRWLALLIWVLGPALALALPLTRTPLAYADGPGSLDSTFNGTGIVTTSVTSKVDFGRMVHIYIPAILKE